MVQARFRRQVFNASCEAADDFTPSFGEAPVTQAFGDVAAEGSSTNIARADHRHGMPDAPTSSIDDPETFALFFDELILNTPAAIFHTAVSTSTVGGRDDVGHTGAFGSFDANSSGTINNSSGLWLRGTTTTALTGVHLWQRVKRLVMRVLAPATVAQLVSCNAVVGAITATNSAAGTNIIGSITDGVYFSLATDGAGAGNWSAVTNNAGSITSVDTGRAPVQNGTDIEFTVFEIDYDHSTGTATFYIGDSTHVDADGVVVMDLVATITTNIPPSTRKIGGFGCWLTNGSGLSRTICPDNIFYKALRVGPT